MLSKGLKFGLAMTLAWTVSSARAATFQLNWTSDYVESMGGESVPDGDCWVGTVWNVGGYSQRILEGGSKPTTEPAVLITIGRARECWVQTDCGLSYQFQWLMDLEGVIQVPAAAIAIDRGLDWAHVEATGLFHEYITGQDKLVHVKLDAIGEGDILRRNLNTVSGNDTLRDREKLNGTLRDGLADVSVTDDQGVEYIHGDPLQTSLGHARSGSLIISNPR